MITESDIDHRLALMLASARVTLPPEEVQRVRAQVLRNLIDETLQIQDAAQHDITVEDAEINQYYARFAQGFNQTAASFSAYLRTLGASDTSLKRQICGELAWQRLRGRLVDPFVNVGEEEVQTVLNPHDRGARQFRVSDCRDLHLGDARRRRPRRAPMPRASSSRSGRR